MSEVCGGIRVYRFPFFARDRLLIQYNRIPYFKMICYFISGAIFTSFAILRHRIDLIHVHWAIPTGVIGVLTSTFFKIPVIVTVHGSDFRLAAEGPRFLRRLFLWILKIADHVTCVSEHLQEEIKRWGIPSLKISAFPMGVDENFIESGKRRYSARRNVTYVVLSNRNLYPLYNVSLLVESIPFVLKEVPETEFLIAGDGPDRKKLERLAKSLGVEKSVRFLGRLPRDRMAEVMGRSDVYISTSKADGASVSLLEAMAAGSFPVVADIAANRRWIVHGENGLLFPPDARMLADAIVKALKTPVLLEKGCEKNKAIIHERALWSRSVAKFEEIYEKLS